MNGDAHMYHAVMFHHFTDHRHPCGQGAITAETFDAMLDFLGPRNILSAEEWTARFAAGTLGTDHLCLTFDDALRCQIDVALPVLEARGLTAFWFVYSSVFHGAMERLELYRHVRTVCFPDIADFYAAFDAAVAGSVWAEAVRAALVDFVPETYLAECPFYTAQDRVFRFLRDRVLGPDAYAAVMDGMVAASGLETSRLAKQLWMDEGDLVRLHGGGHAIGLHSWSHPTVMADLPPEVQRDEFRRNSDHLARVLGVRPSVASHPCGSYNLDTLKILQDLGVTMAFRSTLSAGGGTGLETPREDHAMVLRRSMMATDDQKAR